MERLERAARFAAIASSVWLLAVLALDIIWGLGLLRGWQLQLDFSIIIVFLSALISAAFYVASYRRIAGKPVAIPLAVLALMAAAVTGAGLIAEAGLPARPFTAWVIYAWCESALWIAFFLQFYRDRTLSFPRGTRVLAGVLAVLAVVTTARGVYVGYANLANSLSGPNWVLQLPEIGLYFVIFPAAALFRDVALVLLLLTIWKGPRAGAPAGVPAA